MKKSIPGKNPVNVPWGGMLRGWEKPGLSDDCVKHQRFIKGDFLLFFLYRFLHGCLHYSAAFHIFIFQRGRSSIVLLLIKAGVSSYTRDFQEGVWSDGSYVLMLAAFPSRAAVTWGLSIQKAPDGLQSRESDGEWVRLARPALQVLWLRESLPNFFPQSWINFFFSFLSFFFKWALDDFAQSRDSRSWCLSTP